MADLAASLLSGKLTYALAELRALPRAALVVEDRYSALFKLEFVSAGAVAEALAEAQARFPSVPVMWADTRQLAQEWTYRFLGAALVELDATASSETIAQGWMEVPAAPPASPAPADVRAWAMTQNLRVSDRGRIPASILEAYRQSR